MNIKDCLFTNFIPINQERGVASIKKELLLNQYLVVVDDNDKFIGILSSCDLIAKPHKLVADCVIDKEIILPGDTLSTIVEKFHKSRCSALPFYEDGKFSGVIEKNCIIKNLTCRIEELYKHSIIPQNLKKHFLNNISHEVRTPLSVLIGLLDVIAEIDIDKFRDENNEYRMMLKHNIDSFLVMMNDLIDLSKIESGEIIPIEHDPINVRAFFNDFMKFFNTRATITKKELDFKFYIEENCEIVFADYKRLKQIVYNFIDNAIKFSSDNIVECKCCKEKSDNNIYTVFYITNSGADISKEQDKEIFCSFNKGWDSSASYKTGLGIGLSLSKKLSEIMGGELGYESKNGKTTFYIKIPT